MVLMFWTIFQLHCCGASSFADYIAEGQALPSSCCDGSCLNPLNYYGGCRDKFVETMSVSTDHAKYVAIGLIGVEVRINLPLNVCCE